MSLDPKSLFDRWVIKQDFQHRLLVLNTRYNKYRGWGIGLIGKALVMQAWVPEVRSTAFIKSPESQILFGHLDQ